MSNNSNFRKYSSYKSTLLETKEQIKGFVYWSEEFLFNEVGFDGLIGLIPIAGLLYTVSGSIWLIIQAHKIQASSEDITFIIMVTLVDSFIGEIPIVGDIVDLFLKVHASSGERLIKHIDKQLAKIN